MGNSMETKEIPPGLSVILLMSFHPGCVTGRTGYIIGGTQCRMKMQYFLINLHLGKKFKTAAAVHQPRPVPVQLLALVTGKEGSRRDASESWLPQCQLFLGSEAVPRPTQENSQCCVWCGF